MIHLFIYLNVMLFNDVLTYPWIIFVQYASVKFILSFETLIKYQVIKFKKHQK